MTSAPVVLVVLSGLAAKGCSSAASESLRPTLTLAAPWVVSALSIAAIVCWLGVFLALCLLPRTSAWIAGRWFTQLALLMTLILFCRAPVARARRAVAERNLSGVGPVAAVHERDLLGHVERLCRVRSSGPVWTEYDVFASAGLGSPGDDRYASVIRPAGSAAAGHSLFATSDGLVVLSSAGRCYLAGRADGPNPPNGDLLRALSPFVLLGESSEGEPSDLDDTCATVAREGAAAPGAPSARDGFGVPPDASLLAALDSRNSWVRAAARRIVEAGGATLYPEATKRVVTEPK